MKPIKLVKLMVQIAIGMAWQVGLVCWAKEDTNRPPCQLKIGQTITISGSIMVLSVAQNEGLDGHKASLN